jgi:hypothetical protein
MSPSERASAGVAAALGFLAATSVAPAARAQGQDPAAVRALFNEARELMSHGKYDAACPKLEAASKLYAGSGVLLNLGDCYEHTGRTASAWSEFGEAASAAERAGRAEDEAEAHRRQTAIESKLAKLVVRVAHPTAGLVVKRDGTPLDAELFGAAIPVDPGSHTVTAEGPGRAPWSATIVVKDGGKMVTVDVADATSVAQPPVAPPSARPAAGVPAAPPGIDAIDAPSNSLWTSWRVTSVVVAGAGAVAVGAGGLLGLVAKGKYDTANGETGSARGTDSASAVSLGNVATAFVIGGAVAAAAGVVLWFTAPSTPVQVGASPGQVVVSGRF